MMRRGQPDGFVRRNLAPPDHPHASSRWQAAGKTGRTLHAADGRCRSGQCRGQSNDIRKWKIRIAFCGHNWQNVYRALKSRRQVFAKLLPSALELTDL
jgi:hypothetical protein